MLDYVRLVRRAFPDFQTQLRSWSQRDLGELFGISPTGRKVIYPGVAIFRIADGRIAEGWVLGDTRGLMEQLEERPAPKDP